MEATKSKLFYGWIIVLAGAMVTGAGVGMLINCSGIFIKPVCEALGFTRGGFTLYTTIQSILTMLTAPLYGELFRRFSLRKVMIAASFYCCTLYFCLSFCRQLWQFYLVGALMGLGFSGVTVMSVGTLVNRWFKEKKGVAAGLAFSGSGVTAAIMMKVGTKVINSFGWQWGYRIQAVGALVLLLVALLFLIRDNPEDIGLLPLGAEKTMVDGVAPQRLGLTRAQALKTPAFYIMVGGFFLNSMIGMGINPHISACLTDIGYDIGFASTIISAVMAVMIVAKILLGAAFDKIGPVATGFTVGFVLLASSLLILSAGISPAIPWVFALFFGFGYSTLSVPYSYLCGEIFGDREFSGIYSMCTMLSGAGGALGPVLSGFLFDVTGSYKTVFTVYAIASALVIVLLMAAAKMGRSAGYATRA